jgi:hypothetical protein
MLLDLDLSTATISTSRRLEARLPQQNRGEIRVIDNAGRLLIEEVILEDWSEQGCRFVAGVALKGGDIVAIKPLGVAGAQENCTDDQQPQLFEIMWTNRRIAFWVAGAIRLQGKKLAANKFPPVCYVSGRPSK